MLAQVQSLSWETMWAPYDQSTYQAVLAELVPSDIVYEIGAGDLRLARQMARLARHVYAVELHPELIAQEQKQGLPANLTAWAGDARSLPVPAQVTAGVLLMRHCTHFAFYARQLTEAGCQKLFTNARWRLGVEKIMLQARRMPFHNLSIGWYACVCGAAGFLEGPAELLTPGVESVLHEVFGCPRCNCTSTAKGYWR